MSIYVKEIAVKNDRFLWLNLLLQMLSNDITHTHARYFDI